jgi:hypothetical protein
MRPPAARAGGLALAVIAGCFAPDLGSSPFRCGGGEPPCPDGYRCAADQVCRRPGEAPPPDAMRPADAAPACAAGTRSCNGDQLVDCSLEGVPTVTDCAMGCDATTRACATLVASNVPAACSVASSAPLSETVLGATRWDTDQCGSLRGVLVGQGGNAPELCLIRFADFTVAASATLTIVGHRAPVIVALGKMNLAGKIDVAARGPVPGPGADPDATVPRGASAEANSLLGGGGGGHAVEGGEGGAESGSDTRLVGGERIGTVGLVPLTAGGFGGAGGYPCAVPPCPLRTLGGAGGGAIQLVACRELVVGTAAVIDAGGGGGRGGAGGTLATLPGAGDGGGAGGGILIEAPAVTVPAGASLVANGGGGGGGGASGSAAPSGEAGGDGPLAERPADGGQGGNDEAGEGGRGGADGPPDDGKDGSTGGGGGGAPGRIRLNARMGRPPSIAGAAAVSPSASTGVVGRSP